MLQMAQGSVSAQQRALIRVYLCQMHLMHFRKHMKTFNNCRLALVLDRLFSSKFSRGFAEVSLTCPDNIDSAPRAATQLEHQCG